MKAKLYPILALLVSVACQDASSPSALLSNDATANAADNASFVQAERLGNPLVSEVMVVKRRHQLYNYDQPRTDVATWTGDVVGFITGVAGRDAAYANVIAGALLPDMLVTYPKRDGTPVFWLSWVFGGYGGRSLSDDVVDIGLGALFGSLLGNNNNVTPGLTTDNVATNDRAFQATFPYLATAH
ncbi:MAG TPA: DUF4331 family protein [Gemmatimonadaceae bacterium]|nr:DUF4331 family protein [Gemmatimonadaceae bacterium]